MRSNAALAGLAALAAVALVTGAARADTGRIEINQTSVEAAGGFPLVISAPGNFVLTSDLIVPADTQAIVLSANEVVLDLNGFRILGPHPCSGAGCATGLVPGIAPQGGQGRRVTVRGGTIRGFSGTCILLLGDSYVTEMFVSACGNNGIQLSLGSLVRASRVSETGREGIVLVGKAIGYSDNVVRRAGLAIASSVGVSGGTATGGSVCEDGSCSADGNGTLRWDHVLDSGNGDAEGCGSQRFECVLPTNAHPSGAASLDLETGLVWDRFPSGPNDLGRRGAMDFCAKREVGGRKGWHLPMLEQLASLVDSSNSSPALPTGHPFNGIANGLYWTATADAAATLNIPNIGWTVRMGDGAILNGSELNDGPAIWCVRGGRAFDGNTQR